MKVELNIAEISNLKTLAKRQARDSLKFSKDVGFSQKVREIFRNDFHRYFNLYKKLNSFHKNFLESL